MIAGKRATLALAVAVLALGAGMAYAQQDEGPILRPKTTPVKPALATLLVTCDLACDWTLDGEARGRIEAGETVKTKVTAGQHAVTAETEDALDKAENKIKVRAAGETSAHLWLEPVRDARLKAEQEAREKAIQEARDKAAQEERDKAAREAKAKADREARDKAAQQDRIKAAREEWAKEQQEREQVAREDSNAVWIDAGTRLMWTKKDNGSDVNWQKASNYCRSLQLAGYSDWRLPTIEELYDLYNPKVSVAGQMGSGSPATWHVKGNLQLSGWQWSNTQGNASWKAWLFLFSNGERYSYPLLSSSLDRALCVREATSNEKR